MTRRFLVYPAYAVWPGNLVVIALNVRTCSCLDLIELTLTVLSEPFFRAGPIRSLTGGGSLGQATPFTNFLL